MGVMDVMDGHDTRTSISSVWSSLLSSPPINDAPQREMAAGRNGAGLVDHQLRTIACAHIRSFTFFKVYTSSILYSLPPTPLPVNVLARARHRLHARTHVPSHGRTRAHATMRTPIPSLAQLQNISPEYVFVDKKNQ